ncbi:hypothetical protein Patl1_05524 [Pistacia atlantica]|uniref:Uncharacterized protein n=1 Tax=Pistacia atlantica TaxID=434234 RepID=A0ACC1BQX4_9ROSI|nr:hypothetical protein Patl1_05524 [Pistacia atlantica]
MSRRIAFTFAEFLKKERDEQIGKSVSRMMTIIDLAVIFETVTTSPIKSPLRYASNLSSLLLCL